VVLFRDSFFFFFFFFFFCLDFRASKICGLAASHEQHLAETASLINSAAAEEK
jgi:hypothetical protein